MTDAPPPRRRFARVLLVVAITACVLVTAAVVERRMLVREAVSAALRARGVDDFHFEVESLDGRGFALRDLRVGTAPDLAIEEIRGHYSTASLTAGRLDRLEVRGLRLHGSLGAEGWSFGALDALVSGDEEERAAGPVTVTLPARAIRVGDAILSVMTPEGPLTGQLSADLREQPDGSLAGEATAGVAHPSLHLVARVESAGTPTALSGTAHVEIAGGGPFGAGVVFEPFTLATEAEFSLREEQLQLHVAGTPIDLSVGAGESALRVDGDSPDLRVSIPGDGDEAWNLQTTGGLLRLPDFELEIEGIAANLGADATSGLPAGRFEISRVSDLARPRRFTKVAVTGSLESQEDQVGFEIRVSGSANHLRVDLNGRHDPASGSGSARIAVKPLEFSPSGLQPSALSPLFGESIAKASGRIEATGHVVWSPEHETRTSFDLGLRDLSIDSIHGAVTHLDTALRIDGPWPLSTPPRQLVSMARIDFGLALHNGLVEFRLRRDGRLDLASARWSLAGGTIGTRGQIDPWSDRQKLDLVLADLDLAKLLELADLAGLSGEGTLHGRIPVERRGPTVEIRGGSLAASDAGGWIRYRPGGAEVGGGSGDGFGVVLAALENFQFEKLEATIDGDTAGPVLLAIHLAGANPDYLDGHPIEFNLQVESHLVDLLSNASAAYRIPAEIEKRLEEISLGGSKRE